MYGKFDIIRFYPIPLMNKIKKTKNLEFTFSFLGMNYKSCYISCPLLKIKLQHFSNFYKFSFLILYPNLRKLLLSLLLALHCGGGKSSQLAHHQLVLSQCRNEKLSKRERNLILCGGGSCIRYCEWMSFLIQAHRQSESEILEHSLKIEEFKKKLAQNILFEES